MPTDGPCRCWGRGAMRCKALDSFVDGQVECNVLTQEGNAKIERQLNTVASIQIIQAATMFCPSTYTAQFPKQGLAKEKPKTLRKHRVHLLDTTTITFSLVCLDTVLRRILVFCFSFARE